MKGAHTRWDNALTALENLYRDVEKRSLSLPGFSLLPIAIFFWNTIKFIFCLWLDILLLLPMNVVIFLRNLFPGKWHYHSFSGRYWIYVITWLWRGEAPVIPIGIIRPLVTFLVVAHAHNRIGSLKRYVYLDDSLSDENRLPLETKIARMQERWKRPTAPQVVYSYVLPVSGPLIEVYRFLFPGNLAPWFGLLGLLLISYSIAFVVSAFMVKRALMLGASGRALYFPGALAGTQCYGNEREILGSLGIRKREFPFDVAANFVSILVGYLLIGPWLRFYMSLGMTMPPTEQLHVPMLIQGALFALLSGLVLYRRKARGRV